MKNGSTAAAVALAKARWAQYHAFDLDDETWLQLFREHFPGDVLEGIKRTSNTRDPRPEKIFATLEYWVQRFESERNGTEPPMWPPSNTTKI